MLSVAANSICTHARELKLCQPSSLWKKRSLSLPCVTAAEVPVV